MVVVYGVSGVIKVSACSVGFATADGVTITGFNITECAAIDTSVCFPNNKIRLNFDQIAAKKQGKSHVYGFDEESSTASYCSFDVTTNTFEATLTSFSPLTNIPEGQLFDSMQMDLTTSPSLVNFFFGNRSYTQPEITFVAFTTTNTVTSTSLQTQVNTDADLVISLKGTQNDAFAVKNVADDAATYYVYYNGVD